MIVPHHVYDDAVKDSKRRYPATGQVHVHVHIVSRDTSRDLPEAIVRAIREMGAKVPRLPAKRHEGALCGATPRPALHVEPNP